MLAATMNLRHRDSVDASKAVMRRISQRCIDEETARTTDPVIAMFQITNAICAALFVTVILMGFYIVSMNQKLQGKAMEVVALQEIINAKDAEISTRDARITSLETILAPIVAKVDASAKWVSSYHGVKLDAAKQYAWLAMVRSAEIGVPFETIMAVYSNESEFKARAVSYNNTSYGIGQVHLRIWGPYFNISKADLLDPVKNIFYSTEIMRIYKREVGGNRYAMLKRYYGSTRPDENVWYADRVNWKENIVKRGIRQHMPTA